MLWKKTLTELRNDLLAGHTSSAEVFAALQERIRQHDSAVGAFIETFDHDRASEYVAAIPAAHRLPVALKDNLCLRGAATTCASQILQGFVSPYTATAVGNLLEAGFLVQGRTNMDEFAMGSSTENSSVQKTRNPWGLEYAPGGSSGGSAAAVAAGFTPAALGSDTGGSIRQPAAFCGVVGVKPTYGTVSRYGLVAFASSLDQIGTFTRTVEDAALLLETISGHDPHDSTSLPGGELRLLDQLGASDLAGLRIGVPEEFFPSSGLDDEIRASLEHTLSQAEQLGARRVPVKLPHAKYAVAVYYILATAEASSNLARFDGVRYGRRAEGVASLDELFIASRSEGFGPEVKRRIMLGTYVLSAGYYDAYYRRAQQVRTLMARDFATAFAECDVILGPVTPTPPFKLGERTSDPLAMYLSDIYTIPVNLVGLPGMSLPCGFTRSGLPIGAQLIAPLLGEPLMLRVADALERRLGVRNEVAPLG